MLDFLHRNFESTVEKFADIKTLYVATSALADTFARICLCSSEQPVVLGGIRDAEDGSEIGKFYEIITGEVLCSISSCKISPNEANIVSAAILKPFEASTRVYILSSDHQVNLRLDIDYDFDLANTARCLTSTAWTYPPLCTLLEQPNIIGGLPAACKA